MIVHYRDLQDRRRATAAENIDGVPCVNGKPIPPLTTEEMAEALAQRDEVDRKFGRR